MSNPTEVVGVIVCAGDGTRATSFTGGNSKEMLTCVDRPAINLIIAEGLQAGINKFVIITNRRKTDLNHWVQGTHPKITEWTSNGKSATVAACLEISEAANIEIAYQDAPLGLGHAVLQAKDKVGNRPFVVFLPDEMMVDLVQNPNQDLPTPARELVDLGLKGWNATLTLEVPADQAHKYGIVEHEPSVDVDRPSATRLREKPTLDAGDVQPRNAIVGRYVFQPEFFAYLEATKPGVGGEIQLTDAMNEFVNDGHPLLVTTPLGDVERFDIGGLDGYINFTSALIDARSRGIVPLSAAEARNSLVHSGTVGIDARTINPAGATRA
ncbi:MAG: sugar phosphate nucleotidyltransferase [Acidimicrobiia bacterium]